MTKEQTISDVAMIARNAIDRIIELEKREPVAWRLDDGNGDFTYFDKRWGVIPPDAEPLYA